MSQVLTINNASKSFNGRNILDAISFSIKRNSITGLFGRNGCGKSTLLKLIFGTLKADSIEVYIDELKLYQKEIIPSKNIAYLSQDSFLPKELTVRKVISLLFKRGEDQDKIFYAKGVASFEKLLVGKLSIGQLRYLELLLIGHLNHDFLLLDEPFSMIEPLFKDIIQKFLLQLKKTKGIILTDHYYQDVLEITDTNYILKEGKLIKVKSKQDLIKYDYLKRVY